MLALLTISFVGYALYLSLSKAVSVLATPFITCCLAILLLYVFSIVGYLNAGLIVFIGAGIFLGLYAITRPLMLKEWLIYLRATGIESLLYPLFAFPFLFLYIAIAEDFLFTGWDEFSFWLVSSKIIYFSSSLWTGDTSIGFKNYPPAQQLFQYLFLNSTGWSEKTVLYAQSFLILSALLYSATALVKDNITRLFLFFLFCILVYMFGGPFSLSGIYADPLLGVVFSGAFISAIKFNGKLSNFALTTLFTAVLVLVKEIGLILACIVFLGFSLTNFWSITAKKNQKILYPLAFLLFILIVFESWQLYLYHNGVDKPINTASLLDQFLNYDHERLRETLSEFTRRLIKPGYLIFDTDLQWGKYFSVLSTICFVTLLSFLVCLVNKTSVFFKSLVISTLSLSLGYIIYISFLLFAYLVFFIEYEGIRLASFERYFSSYMFASSIIGLTLLLKAIELRSNYGAILVSSFLFCLLAYCSPANFKRDFQGIQNDPRLLLIRAQIQARVDHLKVYIAPTDKVYFIHQNSTGYEAYLFYYLISPNTSSVFYSVNSNLPYPRSVGCWSLGPKYYPGDIWTCDQNLSDLLKDYNYIVINNADEKFWEANASLFEKSQSVKLSEGVYKRLLNANRSSIFQKLD